MGREPWGSTRHTAGCPAEIISEVLIAHVSFIAEWVSSVRASWLGGTSMIRRSWV